MPVTLKPATVLKLAAAPLLLAITLSSPAFPQHHGPAPAPASVHVPEAGTALQMGDAGGRPTVDVMIDGKGPYRFILDTGAHISVIDTKLNDELALPAAPGVRAVAPGGRVPNIVTIVELRVGDAILGGVIGAVMPLSSLMNEEGAPRGVLSASSFPGHLVTFDYPAKRITIAKGALSRDDSDTVFAYDTDDPLPTVPIRIAGKEARVHLDTGSGYGLSLPTSYVGELSLTTKPQEVRKAKTLMGEFPVTSAQVQGPIQLGRHTLGLTEVQFSDIGPSGGSPMGNIGYEVLRGFVITLDSKNRLIRVAKPS